MHAAALPKFESPPVVEVALSILFEPLEKFRSAHAGRFWERIREQFPSTADQAELPYAIEEATAPAPPPRLEFIQVPRLRTWFQSADGTQLLQVQYNRIAYNWKRGMNSQPYPSYDEVESRFLRLLPMWLEFIDEERLGRIVPTQSEVTYVNHIREPHNRIGNVFTLWRGLEAGAFLPAVDDVRFTARYAIKDREQQMIGRLVAEMQPAYISNTREEILKLHMVARGKPQTPDTNGAMEFLRLGHEWIVLGFDQITTPEMHVKWGKK